MRRLVRLGIAIITPALAVGGLNALSIAPGQANRAAPNAAPSGELPDDDPGRGLRYGGLLRSDGDANPAVTAPGMERACEHGFAMTVPGDVLCTHGPDPAPAGVDASVERSSEEIVAATEATAAATGTGPSVPCYGDGMSGKRVQALYVRTIDRPDRYASLSTSMAQWATNTDRVFLDSAAKLGGVRHLRYVTDASCNLVVDNVVIPTPLNTGGTVAAHTFNYTISELQKLGYNRTDRKYMLWVDVAYYCGIGNIRGDTRPGADNSNNGGPSYARTDSGCWGSTSSVEAHELMHNVGGVQLNAPHASGGWHCTDESDRMCYSDAAGVTMVYDTVNCPSTHDRLFDCKNDDYYSVAPQSGTYLSASWNAANSAYLEQVDPPLYGTGVSGKSVVAPNATTTTTSSTTSSTTTTSTTTLPPSTTEPTTTLPTTTSSTTTSSTTTSSTTTSSSTTTTLPPTTTVSFGGSLSRKNPSRSFRFSAGDGLLSARLSFPKSPSMTMTLKSANGAVVGTATGPSVVVLSNTVAAGTYLIEVSGGSGNFSLSVTTATPVGPAAAATPHSASELDSGE